MRAELIVGGRRVEMYYWKERIEPTMEVLETIPVRNKRKWTSEMGKIEAIF